MAIEHKIQKNILRLYKDYSNEEILKMVLESLPRYIKLVKSEEIAKEILKEYNTVLLSFSPNSYFKKQHQKLMVCAKLREISIPDEAYDVLVTVNDIIERIKETQSEEISIIDEYCYKYDGYCGNGMWNIEEIINQEEYDGAWIRMDEVRCFYEEIINNIKERYNEKTLTKIKK